MTEQPRPYSPEDYEEQLAQAGSFPLEWTIGTPEYEAREKKESEERVAQGRSTFTKVVPRGLTQEEEQAWLAEEEKKEAEALAKGENDQDALDRETAWHHLANPNKPLSHRHVELARLFAAGKAHWEIEKLLGYSRTYISILSSHPKMRKAVRALQDKTFEMSVQERIKGLNHAATDVLEERMLDEREKSQVRVDIAKWLVEKTTGKAKQEIETKDSNLSDFMSLLRESIEQKKHETATEGRTLLPEAGSDFIDVTPEEPKATQGDALALWIDKEL